MPLVPTAAALLTAGLLAAAQLASARPLLLAERFQPGLGWLEIAALALYAGWLARRLAAPRTSGRWRRRLWWTFSAVFFAQLLLGLAGAERFLMTGELHLPVPAMILAGPLYRGEGLFMPVLLLSTLLFVGPAWCSHLCYIGAWDAAAADAQRRPAPLRWRQAPRLITLVLVAGVALALRLADASGLLATALGISFGLLGLAVMLLWSRRRGLMVHCTSLCPIGLVVALAGKLSPFRVRVSAACTDCGACTAACRYDALRPADVRARRPALSCTLCGDCVGACPHGALGYRFGRLRPESARALFLVLVVALHASFLGLARI